MKQLFTISLEKWDTAVGWVNFQRKISTYNPDGKQLSYIQEKWNGTDWINLQSPQYWVYDVNGNVESITRSRIRTGQRESKYS